MSHNNFFPFFQLMHFYLLRLVNHILYLDYSKDSTLAGITMTESQLTYFIKKEGTVEKGDGKKFSNSNLKSILKKVYE